MPKRRALFLDRDGVINVDRAYVSTKDDFEFIDGIFPLCREAKRLDYLILVITNQAGIARGFYTEQDFQNLTAWMKGVFHSEGCDIDGVYYSPYHPEYGIGPYKLQTDCRKPNPGMILRAAIEFDVDLLHSVLVGDKSSDIQAGLAAGVGCNLLFIPPTGNRYISNTDGVTDVLMTLLDGVKYLVVAEE